MTAQPEWRADCRTAARTRAEAEVCTRLQLAADAVIPFNYRWEHVQRVVQMALWLADTTGADPDTVEAAAWLHDICKREPNHGKAGAVAAQEILRNTDFPPNKIATVADAIARHVGLTRKPGATPMTPLEAAVLWDADKLTKLGVSALAYNLSLRQFDGMTLAERCAELAHFTRTVLVKTVASMNTAPARALAEARYQAMVAFLEQWEREDRS